MDLTSLGDEPDVLMSGQARQTAAALENAPEGSDWAGLEAIYRLHHGFVWRNARRLGAPESMLDDVAHEVFLVVARRLHEFRGDAHVRSWLFAITYHVIRRLRRDRARYARRLQDYGSVRDIDMAERPSCESESAHELRRMLQKLSESKRLIFIMAELEGMTSVEIARCLQLKIGTVDSRLRAARLELERHIEREEARTRRFWP